MKQNSSPLFCFVYMNYIENSLIARITIFSSVAISQTSQSTPKTTNQLYCKLLDFLIGSNSPSASREQALNKLVVQSVCESDPSLSHSIIYYVDQ